jgi:hypothetical protein
MRNRGWTLFGLLHDVLLRKQDRSKELIKYFPKHLISNPDHIRLYGIVEKASFKNAERTKSTWTKDEWDKAKITGNVRGNKVRIIGV